ncbi:hypothetical protein NDU88_000577 [Pleurodeles waltl]|uniref:Uncharacterized protein n=1 Tax=Pleurodeles waltl TaxID=8319 RepID=A0AAV7TG53_PLEWA|nr:hypothetical protein NDU88_000577 [Pleurodeles waltl]
MDILIRDAKDKRDKLMQEITLLEKEIDDIDCTDNKAKNYNILKDVLHKHQLYIKDKKLRKLKRDDNDYKNGRVFTFARKYDILRTDMHAYDRGRLSGFTSHGETAALSDAALASTYAFLLASRTLRLETGRGLMLNVRVPVS